MSFLSPHPSDIGLLLNFHIAPGSVLGLLCNLYSTVHTTQFLLRTVCTQAYLLPVDMQLILHSLTW